MQTGWIGILLLLMRIGKICAQSYDSIDNDIEMSCIVIIQYEQETSVVILFKATTFHLCDLELFIKCVCIGADTVWLPVVY